MADPCRKGFRFPGGILSALRGLPSTWSKTSPNASETRGSTPNGLANICSLLTMRCQESFPTDRLPSPPQKIPGPFPNPTQGKQKHPASPSSSNPCALGVLPRWGSSIHFHKTNS